MKPKKKVRLILSSIICTAILIHPALSQDDTLSPQDLKIKQIALECRAKVTKQLETLISRKELTINQLFDTFYIPIPDTSPQKYNTQYDKYTDLHLQSTLDEFLGRDGKIIYVVAVDVNGYLPTHNSRYSKELTGIAHIDVNDNRTKRIFNDRTGLAAARNEKEHLIQKYNRDTGESMADLSVPIYISGRHWGAIRIGYYRDN